MRVKAFGKMSLLMMMLTATVVAAEEALSQAFLDYMVAFQTEEGEWIDPEELEMMAQLGAGVEDVHAPLEEQSQVLQKVNANED
ncbi:MAG: hypothetical protein MI976_31125 [Pseudomonadales bacterium]|nr:hypothetical protein [Pseudomonadales bacterium]